MRLDAATDHQSFIADGAQPALSNDGTQLAYAASPRGLAVRDLATAQTRTIALRQLGTAADMLSATIDWLGDGSHIAIVPSPTPWDLGRTTPETALLRNSQQNAVVVFVHVPALPAPLTADCAHLTGPALTAQSRLREARRLQEACSSRAMRLVTRQSLRSSAPPARRDGSSSSPGRSPTGG